MSTRPNIRILNSTGQPQDTEVRDLTSRQPFQGVTAIELRVKPDSIPKATIDFAGVTFNVEAEPVFRVQHPITGEWKEVKRIVFKDGSDWTARGQ